MTFHTHHIGHFCSADVGRINENLRNRQCPVLAMKIVDRVSGDPDRLGGIKTVTQVDQTGIQSHGRGKRLERRSHFIGTGRHAVKPVLFQGLSCDIGVIVRQ